MKKEEKTKHPYLQTFNWLDGTLCFWRNNKLYSQKSKEYFEESVKRFGASEKNHSSLNKTIL